MYKRQARAEAMKTQRRADHERSELNEKLRELEARCDASERREAQYCRDAAAQKKKREKAEAALSKLNGSHGEAEAKAQKAARLADQFRRAADEAKRAAEERDAAAALEQRKKMGLAERLRLAVAAAEPGALEALLVQSTTSIDEVLHTAVQLRPACVVVDSIQTVFLEDATGSPGSTSQVRECATALLHAAKTAGMPVFIIGHVTKSGDIAGPRVLEHIVDVVLYMEGDADRAVRVLRGHKNRYGSVDEVGVFEMADEGLKPVPSPSALFMGERVLTADVSSCLLYTSPSPRDRG